MEDQTDPDVLVKQQLDQILNNYKKLADNSAEFDEQVAETMADINKIEHLLIGVNKDVEKERKALRVLKKKEDRFKSELEKLKKIDKGSDEQLEAFLSQIDLIKSMSQRANSTIRSIACDFEDLEKVGSDDDLEV